MRSLKLTPAIMAAAALLALATAGSAGARTRPAQKHATGTATCRVSLAVAPRLVTAGETVLAYGQNPCAAAAGQAVTLYQRSAPGTTFSVAGTTTTDSHGFYQLTTAALSTNSAFYTTIGTLRSQERSVRVAAQVALTGPAETKTLFAGIQTGRRNAVTFSGSVSPNDAGAFAVLQRENALRGTEWIQVGKPVLVDNTGHFSITHAFGAPGASSIRVVVRGNKRNVASPSNVLSYVISQAQNPALTIESAQDPLAYGGSTVISGVVAGTPNTTVTLMGRTASGKNAPLGTAKTDATGKYSFAPVAPLTSMFYKVQGAGRTSAILYQGVKYILTASSSASSVQSGQPLTFSGSVTPAKAGHAIYLEKLNAIGQNYHVVAVGTVASNGTYSISRAFFAPGAYTLRVKIPGDSENGGTASTAFPTTVTALASAKVPAEAPLDGGLPTPGK
jgi:hypothetical protein